ncbi:iron uptake transporter permease EfeU [Streptomyces sp. NRRL F-5126]|uniref:iron uptake transporter permease EfeU n=1 Tax=Streptomyces sp. NRRL F-5126 TaxID=1463857 RepID=UPI0004CC86A2|nr:iron uptake transporter permease EfeU [Streptomyces sp. NRRL F-5126]
MTWADAFPNLLIGLREGLEAGLVVSILLAALRRTAGEGKRVSTAPVWLGVVGAVAVAASFATVLTFSTDVLSSAGQEIVGGTLSVLAVVLVTLMVFWMRRTAASLSGDLRSKVAAASQVGAGALAATAFLAVGREGLETTLFLWTAARASGETVSPLIGAGLGLALACLACWLLFRRAIRINLGAFFSRTAFALLVITAGVLAYGLGELQNAGLLPGHTWTAFDVSGTVPTSSWWVTLITGVTELTPRMTVLQVVAWVVYLGITLTLFVRATRPAAARRPSPAPRTDEAAPGSSATAGHAPAASAPAAEDGARVPGAPARPGFLAGRSPWTVGAVLVVAPALAATGVVVFLPSGGSTSKGTKVTVTASGCASDWTSARAGTQTFQVANKSGRAGEINLDNASGAIVGEIETLGPATTGTMTATLGAGAYTFKCLMSGKGTTSSRTVTASAVAGSGSSGPAPVAVKQVSVADLKPAAAQYRAYVRPQLTTLAGQVAAVRGDIAHHHLDTARRDWLPAQLTWDRIGAAYGSFGDLGDAVDGLPQGLPGGVHDKDFTGLHRVEYGLWHGESAASLLPVADRLGKDVATLREKLPQLTVDPTDLPLRAHEILEDALRDRLTGAADQGSGAMYAETEADVEGTRVVLGELAPLLRPRSPGLLPTASKQLDALDKALEATRQHGAWRPFDDVPLAQRQQVDARIGSVLETLDAVPDLLEVPLSR